MMFSQLVFYFLIIIPSAIFHEYAHGHMADKLGDKTARYAGRLTLNPKVHIDPFGTLLLPLLLSVLSAGSFMFAYAKPVPFNPYNLRGKYGSVWVALAGPAANMLLAIIFALAYQLLPLSPMTSFFAIIVYANVMLAVFNLVPIPPLDGSKLLLALLPEQSPMRIVLNQYGMYILLLFIFFGGRIISPIIQGIAGLLLGGLI